MKSILSVFIIIFSISIYCQTTDNTTASQDSTQTSDQELTTEDKIMKYAPLFGALHRSKAENEISEYDTIKQLLDDIENEYFRRLMVYMDDAASYVDDAASLKSYSFSSSVDYFKSVSSRIRNNQYLNEAMNFIALAQEKFLFIKEALAANDNVDQSELKNIEKRLYKNKAILYMFKGTSESLKIADVNFRHLLDNELLSEEKDKIEIMTYLAGINYRLAEINLANRIERKKNLQYVLFYLWKLTEINTTNNEKLKEFKLKNLIKEYYTIIDYKGENYRNMYKPYVEKIGIEIKSPETISTEKESTDNTGSSSTSSGTSTTSTTTTEQ